jgi:hypothetical protein
MENNFVFENKNNFDIILIKPTNIDNISWINSDYTDTIIKLKSYEIISYNSQVFADLLLKNLEINKYNREDLNIFTQIIDECPNYIYELIYIQKLKETDDELNGIATLLNTNGDKVYGNALFMKTYIPSLSKSILIVDIKLDDIKYVLDKRVKTNIVCFDEEWSDKIVVGNLEDFANEFFDGSKYHRMEISFLLHNINIWYEIDDFSKNKKNICGKILDKPIYKCFWFTMITDELRGSILLTEVQKIIKVSEKLEIPFSPKKEWMEEEQDEYGRDVIKNKYKILDLAYELLNK